ncbi:MAG TPA: hypothetical protein VMW27_07775 [Thermoanaerobaculia bacterium]|nr:hypothetical protein [Thermoanaerobaculia bacterium]
MRRSRLFATVLAVCLPLLTACGPEQSPRLGDAGPAEEPLPEIQTKRGEDVAQGSVLVATGRQAFQGSPRYQCALHEESGLQVNLRTGDPDLPAVTVRIDSYQGSGPYQARLFVTGRGRTGALVRSIGHASLELEGEEGAAGGGRVLLGGTFEGSYAGEAGKGAVRGRFNGCLYSPVRDSQPLLAAR